ncbi:ATP-dependent DNA helicase [Ferrimonas marina]|nr:ATP-dependent RecD-like DNA helicase [Ferrimonas marina]
MFIDKGKGWQKYHYIEFAGALAEGDGGYTATPESAQLTFGAGLGYKIEYLEGIVFRRNRKLNRIGKGFFGFMPGNFNAYLDAEDFDGLQKISGLPVKHIREVAKAVSDNAEQAELYAHMRQAGISTKLAGKLINSWSKEDILDAVENPLLLAPLKDATLEDYLPALVRDGMDMRPDDPRIARLSIAECVSVLQADGSTAVSERRVLNAVTKQCPSLDKDEIRSMLQSRGGVAGFRTVRGESGKSVVSRIMVQEQEQQLVSAVTERNKKLGLSDRARASISRSAGEDPSLREALGCAVGQGISLWNVSGPGALPRAIVALKQIAEDVGAGPVEVVSPLKPTVGKLARDVDGLHVTSPHSRLLWRPGMGHGHRYRKDAKVQESGVLIVTDSNALTTPQLTALLETVGPSCRVVLAGDEHGLGPVSPGRPFKAMVQRSGLPSSKLEEPARPEASSGLTRVEQDLRAGGGLPGADLPGCTWNNEYQDTKIRDGVIKALKEQVAADGNVLGSHIIVPQNMGSVGQASLNREAQKVINPNGEDLLLIDGKRVMAKAGDPVYCIRSNKETGITFGEKWELLRATGDGDTYLLGDGNRRIEIPGKVLASAFQLGYATTPHRFAGNQVDNVMLAVHAQHSDSFNRGVLCSVVSGARKSLRVIGSQNVIERLISEKSNLTDGLSFGVGQAGLTPA